MRHVADPTRDYQHKHHPASSYDANDTDVKQEHVQLLNYNLSNLPETEPSVKHEALVQRFQK